MSAHHHHKLIPAAQENSIIHGLIRAFSPEHSWATNLFLALMHLLSLEKV